MICYLDLIRLYISVSPTFFLNDLYRLDSDTLTWSSPAHGSVAPPPARWLPAFASSAEDGIFVFGGADYDPDTGYFSGQGP